MLLSPLPLANLGAISMRAATLALLLLGVGCERSTPAADAPEVDLDGGAQTGDAAALDQGGPGDSGASPDGSIADAGPDGSGPADAGPPPVAIDWVAFEGGTFVMGTNNPPAGTLALPEHEVTLAPFALGRTEVTVAQYRACREAGACPPARTVPATVEDCALDPARDDHPVRCINPNEARAFAAWVGGRLPTEAEWEFAARSAGAAQPFPWGASAASCERAVVVEPHNANQGEGDGDGCDLYDPWSVCSRPLGNSAQGLCDLIGNVAEWTEDEYCADGAPPMHGSPARCGAEDQVIRGGHWYSQPSEVSAYARSNAPSVDDQTTFLLAVGLRVARSLPVVED